MKLNTVAAWVGVFESTATVALAGVTQAPEPSVSSDSDGIVALVLILGALVVAGGLARPKDPPGDDG